MTVDPIPKPYSIYGSNMVLDCIEDVWPTIPYTEAHQVMSKLQQRVNIAVDQEDERTIPDGRFFRGHGISLWNDDTKPVPRVHVDIGWLDNTLYLSELDDVLRGFGDILNRHRGAGFVPRTVCGIMAKHKDGLLGRIALQSL